MNQTSVTPQRFKAHLFEGTNRHAGEIVVDYQNVVFRPVDSLLNAAHVSWPLKRITLSRGGSGNKFTFISLGENPELTIASDEPKLLSAFKALKIAELDRQVAKLNQDVNYLRWISLAGLTVFLVLLAVLWIFRSDFTLSLARTVPPSMEMKLGDAIFKLASSQFKIIDHEGATKALQQVAQPLIVVLEQSGFKPKLKIARSDDINAFALPGGYVVFHTATILRAESAEEVLGVMAHEFAHISRRHVLRSLISAGGIYFVADLLFGGMIGSLAGLSQLAPYLMQMSFSRDYEREADRVGYNYLKEANINPQGMVDFFNRILLEQKQFDDKIKDLAGPALTMLSTHPDTGERIELIKEMIAKEPSSKYIDLTESFNLLKQELKNAKAE